MKKALLITTFLVMTGPVWVAATPTDEGADQGQLQEAHEQLQQAIETIRSYHMQHDAEKLGSFETATRAELLFELERPRMGVVVDSTRSDDAAGARVLAVTPGSPAEEAGLVAGDVITHVDGVALTDGQGPPHELLVRQLRGLDEGDAAVVDFTRDGESRSATVTPRQLEEDHFVFQDMPKWTHRGDLLLEHFEPQHNWYFPHDWMSMELVSLNRELGEYFGTDEGVLVVRGPENEKLGLKGGDVIISIDDRVVKSPTHAMRILRSYEPDEKMVIEIMRRGNRDVLTVTVPESRVRILEHREGE